MQIIHTDKAAKVVGPYSQAISANGFVYTAGQIGKDLVTDQLLDGVGGQTAQALKSIEAILEAAGSDKNHVLKTTCFLADMNDYAEFNQAYAAFFGEHHPARSTVQVAALPAGALVEIEAVATLVA